MIKYMVGILLLILVVGCSNSQCNLYDNNGNCCTDRCEIDCPNGTVEGSCGCVCIGEDIGVNDFFDEPNGPPPNLG